MVKTKRTTRKKTYKKKPAQKKALNKAIKKVVNRGKPKREKRFFFNEDMHTSTTANSFAKNTISNIEQGDAFNKRDGKKVYMSGIRLSLALQNNSTVKTKYMRVMVVQNKQAQGTILDTTAYSNLLRNETFVDLAPTQTSADATYPLNTSVVRVMYDRVYRLLPEYQGSSFINRYIPIKKTLNYDGTGGGNVPTNGEIYVILHLCEGDDTTTITVVKARGMIRTFYKDA